MHMVHTCAASRCSTLALFFSFFSSIGEGSLSSSLSTAAELTGYTRGDACLLEAENASTAEVRPNRKVNQGRIADRRTAGKRGINALACADGHRNTKIAKKNGEFEHFEVEGCGEKSAGANHVRRNHIRKSRTPRSFVACIPRTDRLDRITSREAICLPRATV